MSTQPFYDANQFLGDGASVPVSHPGTVPSPLCGSLNTFLADTAGVVYRAFTGNVDPWTKAELIDQTTASYIQAGMDPTLAQGQAATDITGVTDSSSVSYGDAATGTLKSIFTGGDPNQPCGITNVGACVPTWVSWVVAGAGVLLVLYVLAPYVGLADDLARK